MASGLVGNKTQKLEEIAMMLWQKFCLESRELDRNDNGGIWCSTLCPTVMFQPDTIDVNSGLFTFGDNSVT